MASLSDLGEALVADLLFGTIATDWTRPAAMNTLKIKLWTTLPAEDGTGGTEVSGGSYAAQSITNSDANFSRTGSVVSNVGAITFTTATAGWGTVVGITIEDNSDNIIAIKSLTANKLIETGDTFQIAAGALTVTVA
jgi:hypothetical protein